MGLNAQVFCHFAQVTRTAKHYRHRLKMPSTALWGSPARAPERCPPSTFWLRQTKYLQLRRSDA